MSAVAQLRRASRALVLLVAGALASEATIACHKAQAPALSVFDFGERHAGRPLISVVTPESETVAPLLSTLRSELGDEYDVLPIIVAKDATTSELSTSLREASPRAVVLVDNSAVHLYSRAIERVEKPPPSVIVMASFVRKLQKRVKNSTAIEFEPAAVTSLTDVRNVLGRPVRRAGVVYREGFEDFIEEEKQRAKSEEIELIAVSVPVEPNTTTLTRALRRLEGANIDAMWIPNDNALLSKRLLSSVWVPFRQHSALPIVAGVPALVQSKIPFGTYAAVPDTVGLGVQTADLLVSIANADWVASSIPVQPAVSVKTYLNVSLSRALGAPRENEKRVDILFSGDE